MRRVESTVHNTGCRVFTWSLTAVALLGLTMLQGSPAQAVPAANPNPHTSGYVGTAGTVITNVNSDSCAGCHRAHNASNPLLLSVPTDKQGNGSQADLCFTCHDGTGASSDVKTEFASAQQNDPSTGSYFRHDATAMPTTHTTAVDNEFGGVLNRHSECTDCHNPHAAADSNAATPAANLPWPSSGRLAGISFVSVDNSTTPRTFTFNTGTGTAPAYEYQLCFKCHSNFTTLPTNNSGKASRDFLDAAAEFDPSNVSFHPIEAAGTNTTTAMANSLNGTSQFKKWNFSITSTVRCTNCHADSLFAATSTDPASNLPSHTSLYRGILANKYEDRNLTAAPTAFSEANFALCFTCHGDSPFTGATGWTNLTNFREGNINLHRNHVARISNSGDPALGSTIDDPGAGMGNALCAECHFRPHSSAFPANGQTPNQRLVNFAPNVLGNTYPKPVWKVDTVNKVVSCDLTCHGQQHDEANYQYPWVP